MENNSSRRKEKKQIVVRLGLHYPARLVHLQLAPNGQVV